MGHKSQERYRIGKNGSEPSIMERKFVLLLVYYLVVDFGIRTRRVRDYGSIRRGNIRDSKFLFLFWRSILLPSDGKLAFSLLLSRWEVTFSL